MNRSSAWIITRILGFLVMIPILVMVTYLSIALCLVACTIGLRGYGIGPMEGSADLYIGSMFTIALAVSVYASARVAFLGLWCVPQSLEAMEIRLLLFARWMFQVAGYMLLAYFAIMFLMMFRDFDPDAPQEVVDALIDTIIREKKHLFLIALAASAFVAWLNIRFKKKEG